jgi:hypothetical protein
MPKANPLAQIAKKLASLQAKSVKVNEEIKALAGIVEVEMKKQESAPAPAKAVPSKPATKAATARTIATPKKMGRPAKK